MPQYAKFTITALVSGI